jgi:hopanoid biosynthesis associated protein HpnK
MVGGNAASDAVARARRLPELRVGLHLVLVDGCPILSDAEVPGLVRGHATFDPNMARAGIRFFLLSRVRRQLEAEIRAQFAAFRATGLVLDHVNAHKHMHLHPTVARLIIEIGRDFGLKAVRVPDEPVAVLRRAYPGEHYPTPLFRFWVNALRRRLQRAGLRVNDHVFGLAWSGGMVEERILRLIAHLPEGISEIYFHPATSSSPPLVAAMPGYRHAEEFATLISPRIRGEIAEYGIGLVSYGDLAAESE